MTFSRLTAGVLLLTALLPVGVTRAQELPETITVVAATYGGNCKQPRGNKTQFLETACNGKADCNYRVDYNLIGDPAQGCSKDYLAEYRCGTSPTIKKATVPPEAGHGGVAQLSCDRPVVNLTGPGSVDARGLPTITVVAGTYGDNCKQPRGNKTKFLQTACDGKQACSYRVDYNLIGDPAIGCSKDFVTEWRCGNAPTVHKMTVPPEAGYGGVAQLSCEDAASLAGALKDGGAVKIYGILFDTDKAVLKAESKATLGEVAKLLKDDPSLRLEVSGHTDNTGSAQHNVTLSNGRAAAVVTALVNTYGIAAGRLVAKGYGSTMSVAPNDTEDNRAKNRRVELRKI